ncbi:MAG: hypothetical protein M9933_02715 [Chitinophagaceae bacterium]|nr:hypothetical protein [Chitinophagaceae bacterium]
MTTLLRTRIFSILFMMTVIVASTHANEDAARPKQFNLNLFVKTAFNIHNNNSQTVAHLLKNYISRSSRSVCVCEIMELGNNNDRLENVAIFAEKTANGNLGQEYKAAERALLRERKQLRALFFDKVKTNTKMAVTNNCLGLYLELKSKSPNLKLYDVLNADVK